MSSVQNTSSSPLHTWRNLDLPRLTYAWPGWLPNGLLTLLAAQPGRGKSALALRICQSFISGAMWPDGAPYRGRRGMILWCESESAQNVNFQRARQWGIRTDRIATPLEPKRDVRLDVPEHREALANVLYHDDVRFAVVDSLSGTRLGDENSTSTLETLAFLASLARDTGKPILVTHHLSKQTGRDGSVTLDRVRGSSAIVQHCRQVWALDGADPLCPELIRLHVIKNNLGASPTPVIFEIGSDGLTFQAAPTSLQAEARPLERACRLLRTLLKQGPAPSLEIQAAGENAGLSWSTMKRAKQHLRVVAVKEGAEGRWSWRMPALEQEDQEGQGQVALALPMTDLMAFIR